MLQVVNAMEDSAMVPAKKGTRARIPCPEKCGESDYKKGIDVRGLKGHLQAKHGYTPQKATETFERLLGRPSMGVIPKKRVRTEPEGYVEPSTPQQSGDYQVGFRDGFTMGFRLGKESVEPK